MYKYIPLLLFILSSCASNKAQHKMSYKEVRPPKKVLVMIDPGHGGEDFGTHSSTPPRYQEKYVNLATSLMLKAYLEQMGYRVLMTRQRDEYVSLEARAKLANCEKPAIFVSVHYNAAPSKKAEGVEVYYYRSKTDKERSAASLLLAERVHEKILCKTAAKSRGVKHGNFLVIRQTDMPAILVEGGFLSNEEEMVKLKDPAYLRKIASGIAEGMHQYLKSAS